LRFGTGNGESFEESFFSSFYLFYVHHAHVYPTREFTLQNYLLEKLGKTLDFENERDPLLAEILPVGRGDKLAEELDGDCSNN